MFDFCANYNVLKVMKIIINAIKILKIVLPLALIIIIMVDYIKAVTADKDDGLEKVTGQALKRFITAVVVFLVPTIIMSIMNVIGTNDHDLTACFLNANDEKIAELKSEHDSILKRLQDELNEKVKKAEEEQAKENEKYKKKLEEQQRKLEETRNYSSGSVPDISIENNDIMDYIEIIPENMKDNLPLIVFLHGGNEQSGMDELKKTSIVEYVNSGEPYEVGDFVFIAPQSSQALFQEEPVRKVIELIEYAIKKYNIDPNRVILTGMSNGGAATWVVAHRRKSLFAGIMPMSGFGTTDFNYYSYFNDIPVYLIYAENDNAPVTSYQSIAQAIRNAGGNIIEKKVDGATHNTIMNSYKDKKLFEWMLSQSK